MHGSLHLFQNGEGTPIGVGRNHPEFLINTVLYNYEHLRLRNLVVMSIPAVVENLTWLRVEASNQVHYVSNWHCKEAEDVR